MKRLRDCGVSDEPPRDDGFEGFDGCNLPADAELIAAGWEQRVVTDAAKSREVADTYAELGFEVEQVPVDTDGLCSGCSGCKDMVSRFSAVYVRQKKA